jgi:hypothetical protein
MKTNLTSLFVVLLMLSTHLLSAQDHVSPKNSVGINATGFVANYLNFGGNVQTNNPYIFIYNRDIGPGTIRFGFDINGNITDDNRFVNNTADLRESQWDARLGYSWSKEISKRFDLIYGADLIYGESNFYRKTKQNFWTQTGIQSVDNITINDTKTYGAGPIAGIQFNVNEKIALYTEARLYGRYQEMKQGFKYENVSEELLTQFPNNFHNNVFDSFNKDVNIYLPLDIYLIFNF